MAALAADSHETAESESGGGSTDPGVPLTHLRVLPVRSPREEFDAGAASGGAAAVGTAGGGETGGAAGGTAGDGGGAIVRELEALRTALAMDLRTMQISSLSFLGAAGAS